MEPKRSNKQAVMRIARCIRCTDKFRTLYKLDVSKDIEVLVDTHFSGSWESENTLEPNCVLSRTKHAMMLFECLLFWHRKLQAEMSLSIAESECIARSQAFRSATSLINLTNEVIPTLNVYSIKPIMKCKVYEDDQSKIATVKSLSMMPHAKHVGLKHDQSRQFF